jgi:Amt family ammonium transporter
MRRHCTLTRHLPGAIAITILATGLASAAEASNEASVKQGLDVVWVLACGFLVFFMQAGFAMVEAGFVRAKNTCNILTKNLLDFCMASIAFFLVGYALMFGKGNGFVGKTSWLLWGMGDQVVSGIPICAFWLFQCAFCGTAATIVSGAVAERMKFVSYLVYSFLMSAAVYPVIGH